MATSPDIVQWWHYKAGEWSAIDPLPWEDGRGQPDGFYSVSFRWADDVVELYQGESSGYLIEVCLDASVPHWILVSSLPDLLSLLNLLAPIALSMLIDLKVGELEDVIWNAAEDGSRERRRRGHVGRKR